MNFSGEMKSFLETLAMNWMVPVYTGKPLLESRMIKMKPSAVKVTFVTKFYIEKLKREFVTNKNFNELRLEMTDLGNGMFKKTLSEGFGEVLQNEKMVGVHFSTFTEGDSGLTDTSYLTQEPFVFVLGRNMGVLPGFEKAVRTMRNQEKARFIIPRLYAEEGNAYHPDNFKNVLVEIEIMSVATPITKKEEIRMRSHFSQALIAVQEFREKGKEAFSAGFYRAAAFEYISSLLLLMNVMATTKEENDQRMQLLVKMGLNCGMTLVKIGLHEPAAALLTYTAKLTDTGVPAENILKGKICLHACRAWRLRECYRDATDYLDVARMYLGEVPEVKQETKMLNEIYDVVINFKALDKSLLEGIRSKITPGLVDSTEFRKSQEIFEATFDHVLNTFLCSKDKRREFYAIQGDFDMQWAKLVAAKHKNITLQEMLPDAQGFVRYTIIKKKLHK